MKRNVVLILLTLLLSPLMVKATPMFGDADDDGVTIEEVSDDKDSMDRFLDNREAKAGKTDKGNKFVSEPGVIETNPFNLQCTYRVYVPAGIADGEKMAEQTATAVHVTKERISFVLSVYDDEYRVGKGKDEPGQQFLHGLFSVSSDNRTVAYQNNDYRSAIVSLAHYCDELFTLIVKILKTFGIYTGDADFDLNKNDYRLLEVPNVKVTETCN